MRNGEPEIETISLNEKHRAAFNRLYGLIFEKITYTRHLSACFFYIHDKIWKIPYNLSDSNKLTLFRSHHVRLFQWRARFEDGAFVHCNDGEPKHKLVDNKDAVQTSTAILRSVIEIGGRPFVVLYNDTDMTADRENPEIYTFLCISLEGLENFADILGLIDEKI